MQKHVTQKMRRGGSPLRSALLGCGIIFVIYLLSLAAVCAVCYFGEDPTKNLELYSMLALVASGGIGTFISAKVFGSEGYLTAIFPATLALSAYVILSFIISRGALSLPHAMNMLCFMLLSALAAFLSRGRTDRHGRRR